MRLRGMSGRSIVGLLLLLWMSGCAVTPGKVYVKDGKRYGVTSSHLWRARWWNYYERGVSYAEGQYWDDAISDFQRAIKQRDADQRRARTYGLHFLDYFPHRELGIVYYRLSRFEDAVAELETSLSSIDTAKAKFYLNKARQSQLEQSQADAAAPQIQVESPEDGTLTRDFTVVLKGYVEDDTYVSAIAINGRAQFIELAEPRLTFEIEIPLKDGPNVIDIVAVDLTGKLARQRLTVTLDHRGPLLSIAEVEGLGSPPYRHARLSGTVADDSSVVRLSLAGQAIPPQSGNPWRFHHVVSLMPDIDAIPFEAEDAVGNITRGEISLTPPEGEPAESRQGRRRLPRPSQWATLHSGLVITDAGQASTRSLRVAQKADTRPPFIKFPGLSKNQTTFFDRIFLEGEVKDKSGIVDLLINDEPVGEPGAKQVFFGYLAELQPGENEFVVEATDDAGNTARKTIVVTRKVQEVHQLDARLRVSLMPFLKKGSVDDYADGVYDQLLDELINLGRFQFVEREQLDAILNEQRLSQTKLVETRTAAKIGKLLAAEGMMIGSVKETEASLEVFVRFVDVETSAILASEDVYGEDLSSPLVRTLMAGLALKIRNDFPVVEGLVLRMEDKNVVTDLGRNRLLKKNMKLIVFREGEPIKHPVTGKVLGAQTEILGEVEITSVDTDFSQGVMLPTDEPREIKQLDKVVTK